MNIVVTNVYSYQNKGDAAIVLALLQELRRVFGSPHVLIQTADAKNDDGKYGAPVKSSLLWLLLSSVRDSSLAIRLFVVGRGLLGLMLFLGLARLNLKPYFLLSRDVREFVRDQAASDLVVACGGGYLRTANAGAHDTLLLLVTCLNFVIAHYAGKPIFLYSQSIGPVHGWLQTRIVTWALNKTNLIESREDISTHFLKSLRLSVPVLATADAALLLGDSRRIPEGILRESSARTKVGITVRKWFKTPEQLNDYIRTMAKTVDYVIEHYNAEVYYIPQVIAKKFGDDDREIALRVYNHVRNKDYFMVIERDLHPFEVIGLCGKMHVFIGTRMHSNIFALISGVPVLAIEYEHKTRGIMRSLGLEKLTLDINTIHPDMLFAAIDDIMLHRYAYAKLIKSNIPGQVKKGQSAMEAIQKIYAGKAQAQ